MIFNECIAVDIKYYVSPRRLFADGSQLVLLYCLQYILVPLPRGDSPKIITADWLSVLPQGSAMQHIVQICIQLHVGVVLSVDMALQALHLLPPAGDHF